jgi:putative ABC transport system substrate-binding protein
MFAAPAGQVRAIRELSGSARRIGVLFDPSLSAPLVAELEAACAAQGATLVKREVTAQKDVAPAARELLGRIDVLLLIPDTTVISAESFKFIAQTSLEAKIPMVGFSEGMAKAGAVLAIEAPFDQIGKKAADAAKKMLAGGAGTRESPDGAIFVNAKSAQLLGLTVPDGLKGRAAKVFE